MPLSAPGMYDAHEQCSVPPIATRRGAEHIVDCHLPRSKLHLQYMVESGDQMVGVVLVERHRRSNLQDIVKWAIRANQHALFLEAVGD